MGIERVKEGPNAHKCAFELLNMVCMGEFVGIEGEKEARNAHKFFFSCYDLVFNEFMWAKRAKNNKICPSFTYEQLTLPQSLSNAQPISVLSQHAKASPMLSQ